MCWRTFAGLRWCLRFEQNGDQQNIRFGIIWGAGFEIDDALALRGTFLDFFLSQSLNTLGLSTLVEALFIWLTARRSGGFFTMLSLISPCYSVELGWVLAFWSAILSLVFSFVCCRSARSKASWNIVETSSSSLPFEFVHILSKWLLSSNIKLQKWFGLDFLLDMSCSFQQASEKFVLFSRILLPALNSNQDKCSLYYQQASPDSWQ